ncbi:MAG TPA: hypothetical protein VFV93_09185 [Thermomicrobiales bacterium]|nr:hypothetical protein [Thermomicrobiales bacterium]
MDEQRNPQHESDQEIDDTSEATARPKTMFDAAEEDQLVLDEMKRFERKRAAIWGLAAGGIMSLIIVICAVLIYLLGTR